ncbi:MAG: LysR family transcriptional regulator [Rhodobacteraceae bacterium]|nr:LysR family transcriptional regulator [Paracoccaceae bacterium]
MRNLDITTLRSFVAVADTGGVTRAAGFLHLTQSAVSMQLKRLEELLGLELLDRSARTIALTASGDQLLTYARRMVALNDELIGRLTHQAFEGEVILGVPHDIVYPLIPRVMQRFNAAYPRVKVKLFSSNSTELKAQYARGDCDLILTTEAASTPDSETICQLPLVWVGAQNGITWRQTPLRIAFCRQCLFRPRVIEALDRADLQWDMMVDSERDLAIEATVSADLAVQAVLEGTEPAHLARIDHGGALPELPVYMVNLYGGELGRSEIIVELANLIRQTFESFGGRHLKAVG